VADEVRSLAKRTQDSTQEIQNMIEHLQAGTQSTVAVMAQGKTQAAKWVDQINDMSTQIATASE